MPQVCARLVLDCDDSTQSLASLASVDHHHAAQATQAAQGRGARARTRACQAAAVLSVRIDYMARRVPAFAGHIRGKIEPLATCTTTTITGILH